jgi:hypothetical protein
VIVSFDWDADAIDSVRQAVIMYIDVMKDDLHGQRHVHRHDDQLEVNGCIVDMQADAIRMMEGVLADLGRVLGE